MSRPAVTANFCVLVDWNGMEDKPFYRAVFLSPSRAGEAGDEPFWGYAVVDRVEVERMVDALEKTGRAWRDGLYAGIESEYYVEIETDSGAWHASLGFDQTTLAGLRAMAQALAEDRRRPLLDIIGRIRRELGEE